MEPRDVLALLKRIPAFTDLDEEGHEELLRLVPFVQQQAYGPGDTLLHGQTVPDRTLIVVTGRVRVVGDLTEPYGPAVSHTAERGAGAVFGRTGLGAGEFSNESVVALEDTEALYIPFRDLVKAYQKSKYLREHLEGPLHPDSLVARLRQVPTFANLTDRAGELELHQVAQIAQEQIYGNGEWLFRQGEITDRLILVTEGRVRLSGVNHEGLLLDAGELGPGDLVEEASLLVGDFHDQTATAVDYARVIFLLRSEFDELLQTRPYLQRRLNIPEAVEQRRRVRQFEWLRSDEWAIATMQRHWVRLFRQAAAPAFVVLLLLPVIVTLLAAEQTFLRVIALFLAVPMLLLIGIGLWQFINWRDDYFVVTTQRVVHIERAGPFSTKQEETPLHNVVDIYEDQPGLVANLLDYGNLILQTAGETVNIDMTYVPYPDELRRLISTQIERSKVREVLRMRGQIRDLLAHRLSSEDDMQAVDEVEPSHATAKQPQRFLPAIVFMSVWEYLFPPSRIETDGGNTIIWKRFWLPGMLHATPALVPFLILTIGGPAFLLTSPAAKVYWGWVVGWLFFEAIAFAALLWFFEDWRNDYFQVTPSHIILIQRRPLLLQESRHEARLDRIQNLGYEVPSIFARVLDYGHVAFETAGTQGKFQLRWVRHPQDVQRTISNRQYAYRQHQSTLEAQRRQQELLSWFSTYDELQRETNA